MTNKYYWKDNTVTLSWKAFRDTRHGDVTDITKTVVELLPKHIDKNIQIVELGCGQGRNLQALELLGYTNLTGVDINKDNIRQSYIDYPDHKFKIIEKDIIDYLKDSRDIDLLITTATAYLCPKELFNLIPKAERYIAVEPSVNTYFTPEDSKYIRYDYKAMLNGMDCLIEVDCAWDKYKGYLFRRKH